MVRPGTTARLTPPRLATLLVSLVAIAALAPAGVASAAPANDHFADREVLAGTPIEIERSNVEASKEDGEFLPGVFAPSGHSVWFEWKATATGWTSVSGCSPDFSSQLGIFQGSSVDALSSVVSGNASEGPAFCAGGTGGAHTFWAVEDASYPIAVDSTGFAPPGAPQPPLEGGFTLRIEATPPPPNDELAAATELLGAAGEEPNGARPYFARAQGYNWGATKELGEPQHEGDPGGASVWYSWTAPESGTARIGACCFGPWLVSIYEGESIDALEPLAWLGEPPLGGYPVVAGKTYLIAVDGVYDGDSEAPRMGGFGLSIFMDLAPGPGYSTDPGAGPGAQAPPPPPTAAPALDVEPPRTKLRGRSLRHRKRLAVFRLGSNERGVRFRCRLDRQRWRGCGARVTLRKLKPGRHVLRVVAIDAAGNRDRSPVVIRFRIKRAGKMKQGRQSAAHSRVRG